MNNFWIGFEKRANREKQLSKEAFFLTGGLAHLLQNNVMKKVLKRPEFGKYLGDSFTSALLGTPTNKIKTFLGSAASGALLPEVEIMKTQMRDLGTKVREGLRREGITHLTPKHLEEIQTALQQGPKAVFESGSPVGKVLGESLSAHPFFKNIKRSLPETEKIYHSGEHPLLSNVMKNMVQVPKDMKGLHALPASSGTNTASLAGSIAGNVGAGLLDPATGLVNLSKTVTSHPAARNFLEKFSPTKKALDWVDQLLVNKPLERAYQQGTKGSRLNKVYDIANEQLFNPVVASAERTANRLGVAAQKAGVNPAMRTQPQPARPVMQPSPQQPRPAMQPSPVRQPQQKVVTPFGQNAMNRKLPTYNNNNFNPALGGAV